MMRSTAVLAGRLSRTRGVWSLVLIACLAGGGANAHTTGTSNLRIDARTGASTLTATWDIAVRDLQWALDLDTDNDAQTSLVELQARRAAITSLAARNLEIGRGGVACPMLARELRLITRVSEPFASLEFEGQCSKPGALQVSTSLFFGSAAYTALLDVQTTERRLPTILSPTHATWIEPLAPSLAATLALFLSQGIWHVLIGYDHIAFLLLLLLPSVLRAARDGWQAAPSERAGHPEDRHCVHGRAFHHTRTRGI